MLTRIGLLSAVFVILSLVLPAPATTLPWGIPRVDGEFTGAIELLASPSGRDITLQWKVTANSPATTPGIRIATLGVKGEGLAFRVRAEVDSSTLDGTWQIEEGYADLARLLPRIAAHLPAAFADLTAEGRLEITGAGEFRAGQFDGQAALHLADATVSNPSRDWTLDGLALHAEFTSLAQLLTNTATPQTLSFSRLSVGGIEVHDAQATFAFTPGGIMRLDSFQASSLGGILTVEPLTLSLTRPSAAIRMKASNIDSAQLAPYLPSTVSQARGRLSGDFELRWDPDAGLSFGDGHLSLQKTEPAYFQLSPIPGFFTNKVSPKISLLGGPLRHLFSIENPAYATLKKIELGEMPLTIESIEASFEAVANQQDRTAHIAIIARPTAPDSMVKVVRFNINISGPLNEVIQFGLNDSMDFSW